MQISQKLPPTRSIPDIPRAAQDGGLAPCLNRYEPIMTHDSTLNLVVPVPAEEWAFLNRRLTYLEALLLRIVRQESALQEWYDAAELEALRLPGLPPTRHGITRKATAEDWTRMNRRRGRALCYAYHVTALPPRAFDALIARIIDLPPLDLDEEELFDLPYPPAPAPEHMPENAAPPWVLPLMRLMKGEAQGNLARAWQALPAHLPVGTPLPDVDEAATVLVRFGLA